MSLAYRTLSRTFKSSKDTEKKVWTLKLKDDEKISIEKTVTAGGMLKLDNEDDEDEQETVERLKDLSATYQWYQVKEDGSEVIIPDASKADLKIKMQMIFRAEQMHINLSSELHGKKIMRSLRIRLR